MNAPRKRRRLTERRLETKLANLFDRLFSERSGGWAETFEQAGVLTGNRGVVRIRGRARAAAPLANAEATA